MVEITLIVNQLLDDTRLENGWTEGQLAENLGVDVTTIWRWRQGDIGKSARILISLMSKKQPPQLQAA